MSRSLAGDDDDEGENCNNGQLSEREAWAEKVEGIWNDVLEADSRAGKPRITLPGFPIEVGRGLFGVTHEEQAGLVLWWVQPFP